MGAGGAPVAGTERARRRCGSHLVPVIALYPHHDGSDDQPRQPSPGKPAVGELVAEVISELLEFQFKGLYLVAETVAGLLRAVGGQLGRIDLVDERDSTPPAVSSMRGPVPHNA